METVDNKHTLMESENRRFLETAFWNSAFIYLVFCASSISMIVTSVLGYYGVVSFGELYRELGFYFPQAVNVLLVCAGIVCVAKVVADYVNLKISNPWGRAFTSGAYTIVFGFFFVLTIMLYRYAFLAEHHFLPNPKYF